MYDMVARRDASYSERKPREEIHRFIAALPGVRPVQKLSSNWHDFELEDEDSVFRMYLHLVDSGGNVQKDKGEAALATNCILFEAGGYPSDEVEESYLKLAFVICDHLQWELYNPVIGRDIPRHYFDLEFQLDRLRDGSGEDRREAAAALGKGRRVEAVDALTAALRDPDQWVRGYSAQALGKLGSERAVVPLLGALKDDDAVVRGYAINALANLGQRAGDALLGVLSKEKRPEVRRAAIAALGLMDYAPAVDSLIEALGSADTEMQAEAARALGLLKDPRAAKPLLPLLRHKEFAVKEAAVSALGWQGNRDAIAPLISALEEDRNDYLYGSALRNIGPEAAGPMIRRFCEISQLEGSHLSDRTEAIARALGVMGDVAMDHLLEALVSKSVDRRRCASWALCNDGTERATTPLIGALADEDFYVRGWAATALAERCETRAIGALRQALAGEKNPGARDLMSKALERLKDAAEEREADSRGEDPPC